MFRLTRQNLSRYYRILPNMLLGYMAMDINLESTCFLCKRTIEVTDEHVFPQWLQRDYNLQNQFILLKNGTKFKYGKLKVPCCKECNNIHLSIIENKISKAVRNGEIDYLKSNSDLTFIWLYKLMFGLHYKEMFLKENIQDPLSKNIVPKEEFFERNSYTLFPLYARDAIVFEGFSPYSLFIFKLTEQIDGGYFYADEPYKMFSSIVLGNIGMVCSFQCDGFIEKDINTNIIKNQKEPVSLPEFGDFCAFVLHLKTRMKMLPNYLCHRNNGRLILRIQPLKEEPLYSEFEPKKQLEITTKMYHPLFNKLITTGPNGEPVVKYKSPFIYF